MTQTVRAQWTDGTTNDITIRNTGTTAINGWTLTFDAPFEITTVWNAQLVSHVGTMYTISNIPGFWNARIAAGTSIDFGFNARLDAGQGTGIGNVTLNGKAVLTAPARVARIRCRRRRIHQTPPRTANAIAPMTA